jgi:hypothetical protein
MTIQFTLSHMFQLIAVVAIFFSLFVSLEWQAALAYISMLDLVAAFVLSAEGRLRTGCAAYLTAILILAGVFLADRNYWASYPTTRLAWWQWWPLVPACVLQLTTIVDWFFFVHSDNR